MENYMPKIGEEYWVISIESSDIGTAYVMPAEYDGSNFAVNDIFLRLVFPTEEEAKAAIPTALKQYEALKKKIEAGERYVFSDLQ